MSDHYAHSRASAPVEQWHRLEDHLRAVAERAEQFAAKFDSGRWGYYAGLWHDLGKFSHAFQQMLREAAAEVESESPRARVNHSSAGALRAMQALGDDGFPLAAIIAGHHAGLADMHSLKRRLTEHQHLRAAEEGGATVQWTQLADRPAIPGDLAGARAQRAEMWIRMLFSALIDADRLDTEAFHTPERQHDRRFARTLRDLKPLLDAAMERVASRAGSSEVNRVRAEVLAECRRRAADRPGIFTLTVPTGGGKTLASMTFALDHAVRHGLDRVIVVIPYTSIIEQTAAVFRSIFGGDTLVEHHSAFDPPEEPSRLWLATENWDAPLVVTTSVQFFETLFANRSTPARKLHNVIRSVIVFDEVQTLPPGLLSPIVDGLGELAARYGSTVVLTTATQPALRQREGFPAGLPSPVEIVRDPLSHFRALERVGVRWPDDLDCPVEYAQLAARIERHERVLAIVHLRNDARELASITRDAIHLSALMCPVHRSEVLADVRERLHGGRCCRLVATQLVEAGVDIDFPVVFRALGGLDSIAQAAGRCNREGMLVDDAGAPRKGIVEVFVAPTQPPPGVLRRALDVTQTILRENGGAVDLRDPALFDRYFRTLYGVSNLDVHGIQALRASYEYASVGEKFRMIESGWQRAVIVPYDESARDAIDSIRVFGPSRRAARHLQRYSVNVRAGLVDQMLAAGIAEDLTGNRAFVALHESQRDRYYDPKFGLDLVTEFSIRPEDLIA